MSVLIRNGRIVTAADDYRADVFVEGETVALIGRDLTPPADRIIDATGRLVLPGGVDPHTHMEMPFGGTESSDTFETGTRAAACGGTTTIVDFAIQSRGTSTLEGLDTWHAKAAGKAAIDYAFHMVVTDLPDRRVPELRRLADEGVTSYKLFMAYPGVLLADDATIFRAMRKAGEDGTLVCMHAENGAVIDELVKAALAAGHVEPKHHALTRPTRLPRKGTIAVGSDADIVIFDPQRELTISRDDPRTHHMNVDYSAYEGFRVRGYPETVLSRGRVVVDNGDYVGRAGNGRFIRRGAYGGAHAPLARSRERAAAAGGGSPGADGY